MRLRVLFSVLAFSCLSFLIGFSGASIKAYAVSVPSGGHYMTVSETRQFIGDTFPVKYYTQNGYVETVAHYDSSYNAGGYTEVSENPLGFMVGNSSVSWLFYSISASGVNTVPTEITCQLQPTYSIFDTEYIYTCFALSSGANANGVPSSATYNSPTSNWYIGGSVNNFRNSSESAEGSGIHSYLNLGYSFRFTYIPIIASSQAAFSAYCMDCNFYGNSTSYNTYYFAVMCPYVSGSAVGGSGAFTTAAGSSGDSVDLTETNGLLDSIVSGIAGIGDSIKGLFVPDQEDLVDFKDDVADILYDSFSGYSDTQDMLDDVKDVLISSSPSAVLEFPALSIPGTSFHTPAKSINLNFDNATIEWVKWIIDIMATIAVVNMIQNKIKAVLVGESVVEVEGIDG